MLCAAAMNRRERRGMAKKIKIYMSCGVLGVAPISKAKEVE